MRLFGVFLLVAWIIAHALYVNNINRLSYYVHLHFSLTLGSVSQSFASVHLAYMYTCAVFIYTFASACMRVKLLLVVYVELE